MILQPSDFSITNPQTGQPSCAFFSMDCAWVPRSALETMLEGLLPKSASIEDLAPALDYALSELNECNGMEVPSVWRGEVECFALSGDDLSEIVHLARRWHRQNKRQ